MRLYRYSDRTYSPGYVCEAYVIYRETPATYLVVPESLEHYADASWCKRMYKKTRRPWAHKTKAEALQAYLRRKFRHVEILRQQLTNAEARLRAASDEAGEEPKLPPDYGTARPSWCSLDLEWLA